MHTVELLATALAIAKQLGYRVREEWLAGEGGGACEIADQKWLFLDLGTNPAEQLEVVLEALAEEQAAASSPLPHEIAEQIQSRRAA